MLNEAEANELLQPYKGVISTCFRSAILDWQKLLVEHPDLTGGLGGRTRSSFIHDRIVHRLGPEQLTHPGLRLKKLRGGLKVLDIRDQLILKLKKLDSKLRSSNIPTMQTTMFDSQGVLEGTAVASTKATAGYTLDALNAVPTRLVVVCWDGARRVWKVNLDDGDAQAIVYEIDAEPKEPTPEERTRTKTKVDREEKDAADPEKK